MSLLGSSWAALTAQAQDKTPDHPAKSMNPNPRLFSFVGGREGQWKATESRTIKGEALPAIERLNIVPGNVAPPPAGAVWLLRGATSNERYVTRPEKEQLVAKLSPNLPHWVGQRRIARC